MNSDFTDRAKTTTTIVIPTWLKVQIKQSGMTFGGAMVAGWNALHEQKEANQLISDLRQEKEEYRQNMVKYRDRWMEMLKKEDEK